MTDKQVVIIGGGLAGMSVARALAKAKVVTITIVQATEYVEQPILMPYFLTRPELYESTSNTKKGAVATIDYLSIPGVQYAIGTVTAVEANEVVLESGEKLPFDYLVVATGNAQPAIQAELGQDWASRLAFVKEFPNKIKAARSIIVGGGGPTAVEMACELRRVNADAKIYMVTSQEKAMAMWEGTASSILAKRLADEHIEVVGGERMETTTMSFEPNTYTLQSGRQLEADIYLPFFGTARTGFLEASLVERGAVKVNEHGQSVGNDKLFAVGCSNRYTARVMDVIAKESDVVTKNIVALATGKSMSATLPAKSPGPPEPAWVHAPLTGFSIMNLSVMGTMPDLCSRCCGCFNPFCPCMGCCGWCCMYPAGTLPGQCMGKALLGGGNMHKPHDKKPPQMASMAR
jgi:NADH dehydrogenase FAD-containing subunit